MDANVEAAKPETQTEGQPRQPENHEFQADVSRLLHLMVHSVYSDRDIFLRELISNGADACEKLRHEALTNPELTGDGAGVRDHHRPRQGQQAAHRRGQRHRHVA